MYLWIRAQIFAVVMIAGCIGCHDDQTPKQMYICRCSAVQNKPGQAERIKEIYVFLVEAKSGADCCSAAVVEGYSGYHETWLTERGYNWVWRRDAKVEIATDQAQKLGCNAADKVIDVAELAKQPGYLSDYYPELANTIQQ